MKKIVYSSKTDTGLVRQENEDSLLVNESIGLFIVADGMGGHVGGKKASSMAVSIIEEYLSANIEQINLSIANKPIEKRTIPHLMIKAINNACSSIFNTGLTDLALKGMGTTVTSLLIKDNYGFIAHVGDSRCYLMRNDTTIQITDDHSLVNEQVKTGLITAEQAKTSRFKNIITRSVGFEDTVAVDTISMEILQGDKLLICSDGLSNLVNLDELEHNLTTESIEQTTETVVDMALERGGDDNITVICLHILSCSDEQKDD